MHRVKIFSTTIIFLFLLVGTSVVKNKTRETEKKIYNIIESNLDKLWSWNNISSNPNITWNIINNNFDKPWNWDILSKHENITLDIINNNLDKPWNYEYISLNPNISCEIIINNPNKDWNFINLSKNTMTNGKIRYVQRELKVFSYMLLSKYYLPNELKLYICEYF